MAFLFSVGWARTSESPLALSVFVVTAVVTLIALTTQLLERHRPVLAVVVVSGAGFCGYYVAALVGYAVLLTIG
jgi:hypothetical protein